MMSRWSGYGKRCMPAMQIKLVSMKRFREKCHRKSLEIRGYDETSPDWKYWTGAEARYHRLLRLVGQRRRAAHAGRQPRESVRSAGSV